jgi:hypothetical protein
MSQTDGGRRWWIVGILVPLLAALIGVAAVFADEIFDRDSGSATSDASATFPAADPLPENACFDPCYPELLPDAQDCRAGSMRACDSLWKGLPDPRPESGSNWEDEKAIYLYGLSCGGRRAADYPQGYRPKDCADQWPGHT